MEVSPPFDFTQGVPVMKVPVIPESRFFQRNGAGVLMDCHTRLFDLQTDPNQMTPIDDPEVESWLVQKMVEIMQVNDAPAELYRRFHL